ncbi:hypothetical protein [Afipia felis]|nr:hypothetical protein [Afipia felis]
MGVKDVQWTADRVSFTYGCAGCGHEIDRPVGEDVIPAPRAAAPEPHKPASDDVTVMEDFPFPFRKSREAPLFALKADDSDSTDSQIAADELADDPAGNDDDTTEDHIETAAFGSMRLLPPKPSWLETPVFGPGARRIDAQAGLRYRPARQRAARWFAARLRRHDPRQRVAA